MKKILLPLIGALGLMTTGAQTSLSSAIRDLFGNSFYATFTGNLEAKMTNDKSLVIVVNSGLKDGQFDKAFVLTAEEAIKYPGISSASCEVFITADRTTAIILNNDVQRINVIGLDNASTKTVKLTLQKNATTSSYLESVDFLSFGLSYLEGQWNADSISVITHVNPFNYLAAADLTGRMAVVPEDDSESGYVRCREEFCDGGGAGSGSCSLSEGPGPNCTVSCKTGYYACCNGHYMKCYCCKNR